MSTAILISGQLRTFQQCYPSQRWHVYRHFPAPHFFITVQDEPGLTEKLKALRADYGEDHVHLDVRTDPIVGTWPNQVFSSMHGDICKPTSRACINVSEAMLSAFALAPYANAAPAAQLLMQHWYQAEVWKFYQSRRSSEGAKADDTILRIRPDQFFHSFDCPTFEYGEVLGSRCRPGREEAFTPWWGRFGGVNDRLAILGRDAARAYFTVYEQIPALLAKGCPFHPESLVKAALLENGCTLHETLRTEFTTLRLDGNHRPPEIMSCDIAHAALRAA